MVRVILLALPFSLFAAAASSSWRRHLPSPHRGHYHLPPVVPTRLAAPPTSHTSKPGGPQTDNNACHGWAITILPWLVVLQGWSSGVATICVSWVHSAFHQVGILGAFRPSSVGVPCPPPACLPPHPPACCLHCAWFRGRTAITNRLLGLRHYLPHPHLLPFLLPRAFQHHMTCQAASPDIATPHLPTPMVTFHLPQAHIPVPPVPTTGWAWRVQHTTLLNTWRGVSAAIYMQMGHCSSLPSTTTTRCTAPHYLLHRSLPHPPPLPCRTLTDMGFRCRMPFIFRASARWLDVGHRSTR